MLLLRIVEQPARYHRFRYETEITGGKLGGLLYGRSGSKSCVRIALSGIDPAKHASIVVIGGTVNPDGYPHPFYMHGEKCDSGAFQWKREIQPGDGKKTEFEICLEKVSLVCVPQGADKLLQAIRRREDINFNPFNKKMSDAKYTSKNLRELRLVFQVYYTDLSGETVASKTALVQTDIVSDIKFQAKLEIEDVHPHQGFLYAKEQVVWVFFKDQLPHSDTTQYCVSLDLDGATLVQCEVVSLKKQLMVLSIPQLSRSATSQGERLRCCIRVNDLKSDVTDEYDFVLQSVCSQCGTQVEPPIDCESATDPPSKRQRTAANGSNRNRVTLPCQSPSEEAAPVPVSAGDCVKSELIS